MLMTGLLWKALYSMKLGSFFNLPPKDRNSSMKSQPLLLVGSWFHTTFSGLPFQIMGEKNLYKSFHPSILNKDTAILLLSRFSRVQLCAHTAYGSPPGSPIPGILQARTLEWVAISFSNAWKWKVKVKSLSCVRLFTTPWTAAYQAPLSMGFSRQAYWSGLPLPSPKI